MLSRNRGTLQFTQSTKFRSLHTETSDGCETLMSCLNKTLMFHNRRWFLGAMT